MKNLVIYCLAILSLQSANALELTHRNYTLNAMRKQAWTSGPLPFAFVSEIDVRREVNTFSSNSGLVVLNAQEKVISAYDATANNYVLTPFYTGFKQRQHLISNFAIPSTKSMLSIGYDSGSKSQKISISKTFFVGFSTYKKIDTNSAIFFLAGGWQKERINEQPCVDEYDREYWCPNLTAWSDRKSITSVPLRFAEVRYERRF
jgi:hypothetical protein